MKLCAFSFLTVAGFASAFQPYSAPMARGGPITALPVMTMPNMNDGTDYALKNTDINNILKQNEEYVTAMGQDFFDDLGSKHQPKYMWIGCADARAPANELMVSFLCCTYR
jgi:hypothetical protein